MFVSIWVGGKAIQQLLDAQHDLYFPQAPVLGQEVKCSMYTVTYAAEKMTDKTLSVKRQKRKN